MLLCNRSLDADGVGPLAQYGLRFPLYIVLCAVAWKLGLDAKEETDSSELFIVLLVGLLLLAFPIYAVQRAVAEVDALTIGALAATTPAFVWLLQIADGRVETSVPTLAALGVFYVGALLAAIARVRGPSQL